ncbi:MAG: PepSY domain-containing protein [Methylophaga sp.]|nr:PepSY domain-containing protein [Methylophaga sp.]
MNTTKLSTLILSASMLMAGASVQAGDYPPIGSQSFSSLIKSVEAMDLGQIIEAEFDDDVFEVKVCSSQRSCYELELNPRTGSEISRKADDTSEILPPADAMSLSAIIESVEARDLGTITEAELDDGVWEIEIRGLGIKTKLKIDPMTGEQTAG